MFKKIALASLALTTALSAAEKKGPEIYFGGYVDADFAGDASNFTTKTGLEADLTIGAKFDKKVSAEILREKVRRLKLLEN